MDDTSSWVFDELLDIDLGDVRLNKRCERLLTTLSNQPKKSIPKACKGWAETLAAYRFFDNPKVTPEKIFLPHKKATLKRIQQEKIVLMIQDTTELNFSHREDMEGMGMLSRPFEQGFHLHPTIAVTPSRLCLGVVSSHTWVREELGIKAERGKKEIEEKESFRWLNGYHVSNEVAKLCSDTLIVNVADSEADIYELFLEKEQDKENKAHWLIRGFQNRCLLDEDTEELIDKKLYEKTKSEPVICEYSFNLPASSRDNRKARTVTQEVRSGRVCLKPPKRKGNKLPPVEVTFVLCTEKGAPEEETPLEWLLLTSISIKEDEDILNIVRWYLCRWQIEVFFKILKSGCEIEELQFDNYERVLNCLSIYMIVAWRLLYIVMLGRQSPDVSCELVFDKDEWCAVYAVVKGKKPPKVPPNLREMIRMVASLGGFLGRKNDGEPGPQTMWIGIQRMRDFAIAWPIFRGMK